METRKLLAILIVAIVLSMAALVWFFPPTGDFKIENPFWNGLTTFNEQFNIAPVDRYDNLPVENKGTVFIVVPYEPFTAQELEALNNYVTYGGTLIILDDFGYGNQILNHLEVSLRFTGTPLMDPLFNYKNKWLPKITDFQNTTQFSNISSIAFNHPTSLNNTKDTTIIAYSSKFSYLDLNSNDAWETEEPTGPLPVAAYTKKGQGYIIAISDPSILINSMINIENNHNFITNTIKLQNSNPQILIDQTHLPQSALDDAKATIAIIYSAVASPLGTLSLIALIIALSLKSMWHKGGTLGTNKRK